MNLLTFILLSAVCYRVGRFIVLDTLIDGTRDRFNAWLMTKDGLWAEKLMELAGCPYCVTVWVAAGATTYWGTVLASWPGWWFPVYWLAVATGGILLWVIIDSDN